MSLNTIPTELKLQIVSYLPFPTYIALFDVSPAWRSVAALFRKTRTQVFHCRVGSGSVRQATNPNFTVHQLLYHKYFCPINCRLCRSKRATHISRTTLVTQYPIAQHRRFKGVYLTALLHPFTAEVTTYELWIEQCGARKYFEGFQSAAFFDKITLSDSHPFLNEPAFPNPPTASGLSTAPTEIELLFCIRFYYAKLKPGTDHKKKEFTTGYTAWEVVPDIPPHPKCSRGVLIDVPSGVTVRQLTSRLWQIMRTECYAEPEPAIRRVSHVRFSISDWACRRGVTGRPVFQLDLEAFGNSLDVEDGEANRGLFSGNSEDEIVSAFQATNLS